eukprot:scaffold180199_cov21-Tisochrysis_lutea.AAC.1
MSIDGTEADRVQQWLLTFLVLHQETAKSSLQAVMQQSKKHHDDVKHYVMKGSIEAVAHLKDNASRDHMHVRQNMYVQCTDVHLKDNASREHMHVRQNMYVQCTDVHAAQHAGMGKCFCTQELPANQHSFRTHMTTRRSRHTHKQQ